MQSAPLEPSTESSAQSSIFTSPSPSQHGRRNEPLSTPSPSLHGEDGGSTSEWSLSPTGSGSPIEGYDTWLSPSRWDAHQSQAPLQDDEVSVEDTSKAQSQVDDSPLQGFPEGKSFPQSTVSPLVLILSAEMLFHVISYLPATDLLTVKLVSRRFYNLVNSPHAWMNAFSRFFPGPETLRASADITGQASGQRTEQRVFTRLTSSTSWSGEYLRRTKLLRCIVRGKPALPFACPASGKPDKGMATFTFSTRLGLETSHLQADWGHVLDKRKPQFIHGHAASGKVSSSDRKGKFDSWGLSAPNLFRSFAFEHPGSAPFGAPNASVIGLPNIMDVSQVHGMVHAEGTPGGNTFFLGHDEKRGRNLASFLDLADWSIRQPRVSHARQCTCALWIAKTPTIPWLTSGLVGILSGSSSGVVSSYSLGPSAKRDQRFERGELTARWLLSPGVPIIAIAVDEHLTDDRINEKRVWAVALNALGEVFYLSALPLLAQGHMQGLEPPNDEDGLAIWREQRAWRTGASCDWRLIPRTGRTVKSELTLHDPDAPSFLPHTFWTNEQHPKAGTDHELRDVNAWLAATPTSMRSYFYGWQMERRLEVDFAGDDGRGAGEHIVVVDPGSSNSSQASAAKMTRYSRCRLAHQTNDEAMTEWRESYFSFGKYKAVVVNVTALDGSAFATTTSAEDMSLDRNRKLAAQVSSANEPASLTMPGKRARLLAAGTAAGSVFVWNMRASVPGASALVHAIDPVRIIHTTSPGITSLALSSLLIVHGGAEGLIQAWDLLGSTLEPLRTLSSQRSMNNRRRLVIAARQNPEAHVGWSDPSHFAATNICLDPDPTVLRGVAAVGGFLRYWSYSSASPSEDLSKTQKRRLKRGSRSFNASPGENFIGIRRVGLKGFVNQELHAREIEQKEHKAYEKEQRRVAGRFGLNLLGDDASDEELLAYAKLLSEEEDQRRAAREAQDTLGPNATEQEIEARLEALSDEDRQKWKFASWDVRRELVNSVSVPSTPAQRQPQADDELAKAIELSLLDDAMHTPRAATPETSSSSQARMPAVGNPQAEDPEIVEAIRQSLAAAPHAPALSPRSPRSYASASPAGISTRYAEEDDLERAIRLSLEETGVNGPSPAGSNISSPLIRSSEQRRTSVPLHDEDEFPSLNSSSPASSPPVGGAWGRGKGKGRM